MRTFRHLSFSATGLFVLLAGGCGDAFQWSENTFWGVNVAGTQGAKTLTVDVEALTPASTSVHLPLDMLDASSGSAKLVLNAKNVTLTASKGDAAFSIPGDNDAVRIEVTFTSTELEKTPA